MTNEELDSLIGEVLSSVLEVDVPAGVNLSRDDEERWNSLKHMEIIFSLEAALDIRFTEDEISEIKCVEDIKDRIRAKHAA